MSLQDVADALGRELPEKVRTDAPLAPLTTYRLGGPAAILCEPGEPADVLAVARVLRSMDADVPVLVLGRGSNTVVSDGGWTGLVLHVAGGLASIDDGDAGRPVAGAGVSMPQLANWAARRGLTGLEFMISIPGSVGGGVRMNAGAHGGDVAQVLVTASVLDLDTMDLGERPLADLGMSYRRSALGPRHVVIDARFSLEPAPPAAIRERMESFRRHRAATQPGAASNAGSVFKNLEGDAAGRLVEAAGLKGFSVGGARVSEMHANFFVAGPGATSQDVFDLVHAVQLRVSSAFGIVLEPEVRFAGPFREPVSAGSA